MCLDKEVGLTDFRNIPVFQMCFPDLGAVDSDTVSVIQHTHAERITFGNNLRVDGADMRVPELKGAGDVAPNGQGRRIHVHTLPSPGAVQDDYSVRHTVGIVHDGAARVEFFLSSSLAGGDGGDPHNVGDAAPP